jgi:hypothetical protein
MVVGVVLVALAGLRLPGTLRGATSSYGIGELAGLILVGALGVWLIRASSQHVRH